VLIERSSVVIDKFHERVYDAGELVHRSISEAVDDPHGMRLVPCIAWWISNDRYRSVEAQPTCIRCIATVSKPWQ
jgi:hypothetical protein